MQSSRASAPPPSAPPPPASSDLERLAILDAEGRNVVGLWRNVLVLHFRDQPSAEMLRRIGDAMPGLASRFPAGFGALAMIPVTRVRFAAEARDEALALTANAPPELQAVAEVIEGRGFLAATARSMATGMALVVRPRWSLRVFSGVEPAAAWLASWVDKDARASAPRRLVEAIRNSAI